MFTVPGIGGRAAREVSRELLTSIIQPRMEEIFSLVAKEIKRSEFEELLGAGVVLTGGGSLLEGTTILAEEIFGLPTKVGIPQGFLRLMESVANPVFSTGVGLVMYGIKEGTGQHKNLGGEESGLFDRIYQWMRKFVEDYL